MSDETNIENQQPQAIPAAPRIEIPQTESNFVAEESVKEKQTPTMPEQSSPAPVAKETVVATTVSQPAPAVSAAKSLELPKAKFGVATKAAAVKPTVSTKVVEVKKDDNPSITSIAIDFVAAAVAIAFAVMIVLDI